MLVLLASCRSSTAQAPHFRFSPRPNRAAEIHWREWGPAAFAEARRSGRPIFLSLAAVWCHWCHVLDETSLSEPRVLHRLNSDFVPVRVDADQHPDVERRYILGGWPTVAVLTASGQIVDGGTYLPPAELLRLLDDSLATLRGGGPRLQQQLARFGSGTQPRPAPIAPNAVENVTRLLIGAVDQAQGGFGSGAKFPQADAVELLLTVGEKELAQKTLDAMLQLEDPVEGGFYRYATRPDWSHPHYEKMLAVQAELISLYARAATLLHQPRYAAAARRASDYVRKTLFDEESGDLWASQDADEHYSTVERKQPPYIDRTLLVDRAAQMISAWVVAGEPALARRAAERILQLQDKDGLIRHGVGLRPLLGDQARAALALLALDGQPGDVRFHDPALRARAATQQKWTAPSGALYDGDPLPEGLLQRREQPMVENALFARALAVAGRPSPKILEAFGGSYLQFGTEAATWALAVSSGK